jgi:hypothetical protein
MLHRTKVSVCSEIHTKHVNTVFGQNVELLNVKALGASSKVNLYFITTNCTLFALYSKHYSKVCILNMYS